MLIIHFDKILVFVNKKYVNFLLFAREMNINCHITNNS